MITPRRAWDHVALAWRREEQARFVLDGKGIGLARTILAAVLLTLAMATLVLREVNRLVDEAPAVLEQLPELGLRGGKLWADPPQTGPLFLKDRSGRDIAVLDLEGGTRLEEQTVSLMVTRTRFLIKGADGSVQAFSLGSPGQPDATWSKAEILSYVRGPVRVLVLALSFPMLFILSMGLLLAELGLAGLLALVPNRLYAIGLDGGGRLRLASLGLLPSTMLAAVAMLLGFNRGLSMLALAATLAWVLLGAMAASSELVRRESVMR